MQKLRFTRTAFLGCLVSATLLLSGGCVYFQELIGIGPKKPSVTLKSVLVTNASLTSLDLDVALLVKNPNSFALKLNGMQYSASALNIPIASGKYNQIFEVPGDGEAEARIPLSVNIAGAREVMQKLFQNPQKVKVLLDAVLTFDTPLGNIDMNFQEEKPIKFD